jgi:hypothetical protein
MGRPRTPTNLLDARSAFKKHPERRAERADEPIVTEPLGEPPSAFTGDQLQAWKEIAEYAPGGVLTRADRHAVEEAARLLAMSRAGSATTADRRALHSLLGQFGMTPANRSKVRGSGAEKPQNKFGRLG